MTTILSRYRILLRLIKRLPEEGQRNAALAQAKTEIRQGRLLEGDAAFAKMEVLDDKIRYLRVVTPKNPGEFENLTDSTVYVLREGNLVEGRGKHVGTR